ncbi:hypothetical protein H6P81_020156 [Aristolochia fimbriata]|uniref:Uncharacterized protein n=1 Tax=Aristolochia fimbriata TaxID=158543 RepID=A0AAV7DWX8_ARIFI|nr:hypothetical protein H6P81_020156 [Aristolochia fimbriata]
MAKEQVCVYYEWPRIGFLEGLKGGGLGLRGGKGKGNGGRGSTTVEGIQVDVSAKPIAALPCERAPDATEATVVRVRPHIHTLVPAAHHLPPERLLTAVTNPRSHPAALQPARRGSVRQPPRRPRPVAGASSGIDNAKDKYYKQHMEGQGDPVLLWHLFERRKKREKKNDRLNQEILAFRFRSFK